MNLVFYSFVLATSTIWRQILNFFVFDLGCGEHPQGQGPRRHSLAADSEGQKKHRKVRRSGLGQVAGRLVDCQDCQLILLRPAILFLMLNVKFLIVYFSATIFY
jgi:hypothetical protein